MFSKFRYLNGINCAATEIRVRTYLYKIVRIFCRASPVEGKRFYILFKKGGIVKRKQHMVKGKVDQSRHKYNAYR